MPLARSLFSRPRGPRPLPNLPRRRPPPRWRLSRTTPPRRSPVRRPVRPIKSTLVHRSLRTISLRRQPQPAVRRATGFTPTRMAGFWVPYGSTTTAVDGEPYVYLYAPAYGWTWFVSPWGVGPYRYGVWGWGPHWGSRWAWGGYWRSHYGRAGGRGHVVGHALGTRLPWGRSSRIWRRRPLRRRTLRWWRRAFWRRRARRRRARGRTPLARTRGGGRGRAPDGERVVQ